MDCRLECVYPFQGLSGPELAPSHAAALDCPGLRYLRHFGRAVCDCGFFLCFATQALVAIRPCPERGIAPGNSVFGVETISCTALCSIFAVLDGVYYVVNAACTFCLW